MKAWKIGLGAFFAGVILSIAPIAAYASCAQTITWRDADQCHIEYTGTLTGENCGDGVCVCSYAAENNCGHWVDGPCPESGAV